MTRETKIGLLVGLAFIIVIGILLSDHIGSTTEPLQAALSSASPNVLAGVRSPDATPSAATAAMGTTTIVAPQPVIPQNYVPTARDPQPPAGPPVQVIQVSGNDPSAVAIGRGAATGNNTAPPAATADGNVQVVSPTPPPANSGATENGEAPAGTGDLSGGMRALVNGSGGELVPASAKPGDPPVRIAQGGDHPAAAGQPSAVPPGYRQVKAEEGDSVTKFAARYMGANNKANREAIIRANPSMTPDGHLVIAGRTYLVPVSAAGAPVPPPASSSVTMAPSTLQPPAAAPTRQPAAAPERAAAQPPAGGNWYTVKENDNLWKIASEQLGAGNRWSEIRDLNKDVLKGNEQLHINMRLKLPPKA